MSWTSYNRPHTLKGAFNAEILKQKSWEGLRRAADTFFSNRHVTKEKKDP